MRSIGRASVEAWVAARREAEAVRRETASERTRARAARAAKVRRLDAHRDWMSANDAAALLGVTANRVRQLGDQGRLPSKRVGARRWYRRDSVERRLAERTSADEIAASDRSTSP